MAKAMMHRGGIQFVMQSSVLQTSTCTITRASHVQLAHKTQPGMMHRAGIQFVMQSSALKTSTCTVTRASRVQLTAKTQPATSPQDRTRRARMISGRSVILVIGAFMVLGQILLHMRSAKHSRSPKAHSTTLTKRKRKIAFQAPVERAENLGGGTINTVEAVTVMCTPRLETRGALAFKTPS